MKVFKDIREWLISSPIRKAIFVFIGFLPLVLVIRYWVDSDDFILKNEVIMAIFFGTLLSLLSYISDNRKKKH